MKNSSITRRKFIGTTTAATAFTILPFSFACAAGQKKPNSKVGGVQLGLTTYSYGSMPHNLEETLQYCRQG